MADISDVVHIANLMAISGSALTRKKNIRTYVGSLSDDTKLRLVDLIGNDEKGAEIKKIIESSLTPINVPPVEPIIAPSERHAEWSKAVSESIEVTGRLPSTFYDRLKGYTPPKKWEGSTGFAFEYPNESPQYIIKSMSDTEKYSKRAGAKEPRLQKAIQMIQSIKHEMNVNIYVTDKIPQYVSQCVGTYLSYEFMDTGYTYQAYFVFQYLPGMPLNVWIEQNKNKNTYGSHAPIIADSLRECVAALHTTGYVHLDLKPHNVYVVQPTPETVERCVLIDFGEALPIGTSRPIVDIKGIMNDRSSEHERFDPIKANTVENKFTDTYTKGNSKVIPLQNDLSVKRIISYSTDLGGLGLSGGKRRSTLRKKYRHIKRRTTRRKH